MMRDQLSLIQEILVGQKPVRYNRKNNKLYIDTNWHNLLAGEFFLVEAYGVVDPEEFIKVWSDRWLREYVSTLIEESWGRNLTKFTGMTLPGGVQFNGEAILNRALDKRQRMEHEMLSSYSVPPLDMIG
jgi:hypothetical protein